jgi:hypothetical protein
VKQSLSPSVATLFRQRSDSICDSEQGRFIGLRIFRICNATRWLAGACSTEFRGFRQCHHDGKLLGRWTPDRLAEDLTWRLGKGFLERNLLAMREFYLAWSIPQAPSAKLSSIEEAL